MNRGHKMAGVKDIRDKKFNPACILFSKNETKRNISNLYFISFGKIYLKFKNNIIILT